MAEFFKIDRPSSNALFTPVVKFSLFKDIEKLDVLFS
jgi:hypothetical protein